MKLNTDGLIIKRSQVGENDRLVTILTRDIGVIRAFAHGASKVKSKSASSTDVLCYSSFTVSESKGTYSISEVSPIEVFFELRRDIEKLSLAQYFCEVVMNLAVEGEDSSEQLRLILNCLYLLSKGLRPDNYIKSVFELRMMSVCGYMPDLSACCRCGKEDMSNPKFDVNEAVVFCDGCGEGIRITNGVLAAMRHICRCKMDRLFSFELSEQSQKILSRITEKYVITHCDRSFTSLDFYKNLPR